MPNELIRVVTTGANPSTATLSVYVDPVTGTAAPLSIPINGTNAGTDTITAYMDSHSLSSQVATVVWHSAPVFAPVPPQCENGWVLQSSATSGHPRPFDGSDVSLHPGNVVVVYYNDVHDRNPSVDPNVQVGKYVTVPGGSAAQQGIHQITGVGADKPYHDTQDTHNWFTYTVGGPAVGTYLNTFNTYQIVTIDIVNVSPPPASAGSGSLQLTPAGGISGWTYPPSGDTQNWRLRGTPYSLTLNIGTVVPVTYASYPYIPVYEGTAGKVFVYNDPVNPTFVFQGSDPQGVDKSVAVGQVFQITGDNNSWNGRFSMVYNDAADGKFSLKYNGSALDAHVDTSQLTIQSDDIAWYNSATKSIDIFSPAIGGGGGESFKIEVDYMVQPSVASVSPLTLPADGAAHALTINLSKPMSSRQQGSHGTGNTVVPSASFTGGATLGSPLAPISDGQGFLLGWTTSVVVPVSSTNGSITLNLTVAGTLTYLSGSAFVTNTVTYINGPVATIATVGNQYLAPVPYASSIAPSTNPLTNSIFTETATFYTFELNPCILEFVYKPVGGTSVDFASGALSSYYTGAVGGKTVYYKTFTTSWNPETFLASAGTYLMGYRATDTVSGLQAIYFSSTVYTAPTYGSGGGGGGGCFTARVGIETPEGFIAFEDLPTDSPFEIVNETGTHLAKLIVHEHYAGWMVVLDEGKLVTVDHTMKQSDIDMWLPAEAKYVGLPRVWFEGAVYNAHVLSDNPADQHYVLWNGDVAHNKHILF